MTLLIAYGSKMGGTAGIAEMLAETLRSSGFDVDVRAAGDVEDVRAYEAVIVGGALYTSRWHRDARRFVRRHRTELSKRPVWLFSSGPLDASATGAEIPPVRHARAAMERIGARGHITFGGRLPADAKGFPASSMAKERAGDWRDPAHVEGWATQIVAELRSEGPGRP